MRIIDRLPISEAAWFAPSPDGAEEVKPYQIVVLVSIAGQELAALPDDAPRFPAILDTGNNHNFAMRQAHLERWAPMILPEAGRVEIGDLHHPAPRGECLDPPEPTGHDRSEWATAVPPGAAGAASSSIRRMSPIPSGCPSSACAA